MPRRSINAPEQGAAHSEDTGARIAAFRKSRKLTLQEAAKVMGISTSALSKIERGELSPTLTTLQKIAAGFGMDLTELLSVPSVQTGAPGRRAVTRYDPARHDGRSHVTRTCDNMLLCHELRDKRMVPVRTRVVARRADDYSEWSHSEAEIFLYVLSGEMELHTRIYEPLRLSAGDSVYYDASGEHCWTSVGDEDAEVLWVVTS